MKKGRKMQLMETTMVGKADLEFYGDFMLSEPRAMLENGWPLIALGLTEKDVACGILTGYVSGGVFNITTLYVAPDYRRKGGGTLLLQHLCEILRQIPGLLAVSAEYTVTHNEHRLLESFFDKLGFEPEETEQVIYSAPLEKIAGSRFFMNLGDAPLPDYILPFSEIPSIYLQMLDNRLSDNGVDLLEEPLTKAKLDRDLSLGVIENGQVTACVIFDHSFNGQLTLAYADTGSNPPSVFATLIRSAFRLVMNKYPPNTPVVVQTITPVSAQLIQRIGGKDGFWEVLSRSCTLPLYRMDE